MPEFLDGSELSNKLSKLIRNAQKVRLAVAFWGDGAAEILGIEKQPTEKVQIICNLQSGGTNPKEIRTLLSHDADVRQLNDLHAKIGIIDKFSFLGSSNMSTNGLGEENKRAKWQEANIFFNSHRPEIAEIFERFWAQTSEINDADLDKAEDAWKARQKANARLKAKECGETLVEVLRSDSALLDRLNVRVVVYEAAVEEHDLNKIEEAEKKVAQVYDSTFSVYRNWESMEKDAADAFLISYDWPTRGPIARGGLYKRETHNFKDFDFGDDRIHPVFSVDQIEGIKFTTKDKREIRQAFHKYVKDDHPGEDNENGERSYNFLVSELAPYLQ